MTQRNDLSKSSGEKDITGEMLEVLKIFASEDEDVEVEQIAGKLKISKPKAQYYLDELSEINFVSRNVVMMGPTTYSLTREGRKYLFEKDLLL